MERRPQSIIVNPVGNKDSILKNPIALAKGLAESRFKDIEKEIRVNRRRNILTIVVQEEKRHLIGELLQVTLIGKWQVKCHQPRKEVAGSSGVIGPIDIEIYRSYRR